MEFCEDIARFPETRLTGREKCGRLASSAKPMFGKGDKKANMRKESIISGVSKKMITSVLALTMMATAIPMTAYADEGITGVGSEEEPFVVDSEAELNQAINTYDGDEMVYITLGNDITINSRIDIVDKSVDLNLNGKAIIASDELNSSDGRNNVVELTNTTLESGDMVVNIHDGSIIAGANTKHNLNIYKVVRTGNGETGEMVEGLVTLSNLTLDRSKVVNPDKEKNPNGTGAPLVIGGSMVDLYGTINLIEGENSWYGMNVDSYTDASAFVTIMEDANLTGNIKVENSRATESTFQATMLNNQGTVTGEIEVTGFETSYNNNGEHVGNIQISNSGEVYNADTGVIKGEVTVDGEDSYFNNNEGTVEHTHTFGEWKVEQEATATTDGLKIRECSVCGKVEQEKIPATGSTEEPGDEPDVDEPATTYPDRVAGLNRFETAMEVADQLKEDLGVKTFKNIVVTYSDEFADSLSATALAADKDAPILVVNKNNEKSVKDYIDGNLSKNGTVYIVGGESVVSKNFENSLTHRTVRLGGSNRYETNLLVLKALGLNGKDTIMVASGLEYADALSASATGNPVMLVGKNLTENQVAYLKTLGGNDTYYVIGGTAAVNNNIAKALDDYGTVSRLEGDTRYETSVAVANKFAKDADQVFVASGNDFPDGLTGGVLANANGAPLLLANQHNTTQAAGFVTAHDIDTVTAIGGTTAISDVIMDKIA